MDISFILSAALTVFGLTLFEVISSIDNAIINAQVLGTMGAKARRWFLTWGLILAVFVVRGLLPWLIIWLSMPDLGPLGSLTATFSGDPQVKEKVETQAPILLIGGGVFLVFLFLHWLFLEEKNYGIKHFESFFSRNGVWFYAVASILLTFIIWLSLEQDHTRYLAFGAAVGLCGFFIVHGFRQNAEAQEAKMMDKGSSMSDLSKLLFLSVIDATFSIDGVLGAFAFTLSVPLILIGNGIGALVVRQLTISNIDRIALYPYLQNGAMYSIGVLGVVMILHAFHVPIPEFASPVATISIISVFFGMSVRARKKAMKAQPPKE